MNLTFLQIHAEEISQRSAKAQMLNSNTTLETSNHGIKLSDMKSTLYLFSHKQRNLQFTSRKKVNKKRLINASNKAIYKTKKLLRREACTEAGSPGGMKLAECNVIKPEIRTTTPNSKSGPFKNPNPQSETGRIGAPAVQAPPEVLTTPSNETRKTTRVFSLIPANVALTTNHLLTGQTKSPMTTISSLTTAFIQPNATELTSTTKGYYPVTNTDTIQAESDLPVTSTALTDNAIIGNSLINMTTPEMALYTRYKYSAFKMELSTSPSAPSQTRHYNFTKFQGTTTFMKSIGPSSSFVSDNSLTASSKKAINNNSISYTTTLLALPDEMSDAHISINVVNSNAKITTSLLPRASQTSEAHPTSIIVNNNATISPPLATINVTSSVVVTSRTETISSATNGGFFTRPGGIAVVAIITAVTTVVLASVCIYSFVSGVPW